MSVSKFVLRCAVCESYTGTRTRPGVVCCVSVAATHRTVTCVPAGPRWEGGGRCRCSLFARLPFPWRAHPEPFGTERQSSFTTEGFSRARRVLRVVPGAVGSAGGGGDAPAACGWRASLGGSSSTRKRKELGRRSRAPAAGKRGGGGRLSGSVLYLLRQRGNLEFPKLISPLLGFSQSRQRHRIPSE